MIVTESISVKESKLPFIFGSISFACHDFLSVTYEHHYRVRISYFQVVLQAILKLSVFEWSSMEIGGWD